MKKKFAKRFLSWVMAAAMVISMLPLSAMAAEPGGNVAKVGNIEYNNLRTAILAAEEGQEVELLADCSLDAIWGALTHAVTINGGNNQYTITSDGGLHSWSQSVTFKNCNLNFVNTGTGTGSFAGTINLGSTAVLTFDHCNVTMDGTNETGDRHGIYVWDKTASIEVINGSTLTIKNYPQDALEWSGGDNGYSLVIDKSTFIAENNRSGLAGTFNMSITNSNVDVINNNGNGSNGTNYTIENSTVNFNNNANNGLSATNLTIVHSKITAIGNGNHGVTFTGQMTMDGTSSLTATENGSGDFGGGLRVGSINARTASAVIESGAVLTLENNDRHGMQNFGTFTAKKGSKITITGNSMPASSAESDKDGCGGGVYNHEGGTIALPSDAVIYNNTAAYGGDDIYN